MQASKSKFVLWSAQRPPNRKHHFQGWCNQKTPWFKSLKLEKWMNFQKKQFFSLSFIFCSSFLLFVFKPRATWILWFLIWFIYATRTYESDRMLNFRSCAVGFAAVLARNSVAGMPFGFFLFIAFCSCTAQRGLTHVVYPVYQDSEGGKWHLFSIPFLFNRFQPWGSVRLQSLFIFIGKQARMGTC